MSSYYVNHGPASMVNWPLKKIAESLVALGLQGFVPQGTFYF